MVASRVALAWARIYTRGMPDPERRARLDELASDLWEHLDHAVSTGRRRSAVQLEIAGRTARGAAADVAWRFAHRSGPLSPGIMRLAGWTAFGLGTAFILTLTATSGAPGARHLQGRELGAGRGARERPRHGSGVRCARRRPGAAPASRERRDGARVARVRRRLGLRALAVADPGSLLGGLHRRRGRDLAPRPRPPTRPRRPRTLIAAAAGGLAVYAFLVAPLLTPVVLAGAAVTAFVRRRHTARAA